MRQSIAVTGDLLRGMTGNFSLHYFDHSLIMLQLNCAAFQFHCGKAAFLRNEL